MYYVFERESVNSEENSNKKKTEEEEDRRRGKEKRRRSLSFFREKCCCSINIDSYQYLRHLTSSLQRVQYVFARTI